MKTLVPQMARKPALYRSVLTELVTPFNIVLAAAAVILFLADAILARMVDLRGISAFASGWPSLILLAACTVYCIVRPLPRLIDSCVYLSWGIILSGLLSPLILIAGRSPRPLMDAKLYALDHRLHFSTAAILHWAAHWQAVRMILTMAYAATGPLVIVVLLAPPLWNKSAAAGRFLLGATLSAIITAACFAAWPAAGPWTAELYAPSAEQARVTAYLERLKSPGPVQAEVNTTDVVSFPSFHVALAILLAVGLGSFRPLRVPAWILAALVCISTQTTGWHYAIDIAGGAAVAVFSIAAAAWIARRLVPRHVAGRTG